MRFTVEFYQKENGEVPVKQFIDALEPKIIYVGRRIQNDTSGI